MVRWPCGLSRRQRNVEITMQPKIGAKQLILGHLISYPVVEEMDIALDENDSSLGDDVYV